MKNIDILINNLPEDDRREFLDLVNDYSNDGEWCWENNIPRNDNNRQKVKIKLFKELYLHNLIR